MERGRISENEYIKKIRTMEETSERHWEFISASVVEFWFTHHGVEKSAIGRNLVETGINFMADSKKFESANQIKLRLEIPGNVRDYLYMELSEKGALLISKDFYFKPDENWLREYSVGMNAFTFVFGNNPSNPEGKDRYYINYQMKMQKRVDRLPG